MVERACVPLSTTWISLTKKWRKKSVLLVYRFPTFDLSCRMPDLNSQHATGANPNQRPIHFVVILFDGWDLVHVHVILPANTSLRQWLHYLCSLFYVYIFCISLSSFYFSFYLNIEVCIHWKTTLESFVDTIVQKFIACSMKLVPTVHAFKDKCIFPVQAISPIMYELFTLI